jgi:hypothetical protein
MKKLLFGVLSILILSSWFTLAESNIPEKIKSTPVKGIDVPDPRENIKNIIPTWDKPEKYCANGIKLNTDVPFIGDCIHFWKTSGNQIGQLDAFPYLMGGLMKIIMTAILVISFVLIVVAGVMVSASGMDPKMYSKGMGMIKKVATGIALLGASGVILKIINPNFFV